MPATCPKAIPSTATGWASPPSWSPRLVLLTLVASAAEQRVGPLRAFLLGESGRSAVGNALGWDHGSMAELPGVGGAKSRNTGTASACREAPPACA